MKNFFSRDSMIFAFECGMLVSALIILIFSLFRTDEHIELKNTIKELKYEIMVLYEDKKHAEEEAKTAKRIMLENCNKR